jgi:hypothetical protein
MQTRKNVQQFILNSGRNLGGEMKKINDAIFGKLTINPEYGDIIAQHQGIEYRIESPESLPKARQIAAELERYTTEAKVFAAKGMLGLKNETWADEDDDGNSVLVTTEQFMERMTLESVSVDKSSSTLWFNDGELFFGHVIAVEHDGTTWTEVNIQG